MNQITYLSSLKRALVGLPPAEVADMLADCERHFLDGAAAGRDQESIARALGDPRSMAAELRAAIGVAAYEKKSSFANLLRLLSVLGGLASFNLLMLVPALVLPILLLSSYIVSGSAVMAGTVITASGVTSVDYIGSAPGKGLTVYTSGARTGVTGTETFTIDISDFGVRIDTPREGSVDIDVGQAVASTETPSFSRWRIVYGIIYILLGVGLWRASAKMARALALGFANYLRLNRNIIKDAARTA